jgi:hypothetical protein
MAVQQREYRPVIGSRPEMERTPEQVAHEEALHQVEETILNIEQAIKRADRARKAITGDAESNLRLALDAAATQLESVRKELFQSAYFGGGQQRLL